MKSTHSKKLRVQYDTVGEMSRAGLEPTDIGEASKILGYTPRHVRRLAESGKLIACKQSGMWFVHPSKIEICPKTGGVTIL